MSETSELTRPLIEALNRTGGLAIRMQSGKVRKGSYWIHLCEEGTPDILFFPKSRVVWSSHGEKFMQPVWIETKAARDMKRKGKTADKQAEFRARAEALGHLYIRATTISEALAGLP